jgi:uncharacterized membrane protein (UPF0182 family)
VPVSSQEDKSRGAALPELKRVIVAFSNRLIMEERLEKALSSVLGGQIFAKQSASPSIPETGDTSNLGVLALEHYNKAKDYLRQGNWAEYGRELENLEKILEQISSITKEKK